ncbi:MAG: hypothetical protein VX278_24125, partial [Myxococcota bacterium]|nr:hypothetical protein [Myxococcota bacterium]
EGGPGGQPGEGGGPGGQPGEGGGPGGQPGEGGPGGQPGEGGGAGGQPGEGGAGGQPGEGGGAGGQPAEGGNYPEGQGEGAEGALTPDSAGPVEGAILVKVDQPPPSGQEAQYTQDDLKEKKHVSFKGKAVCGCGDKLVLRVNKFLGPNAKPSKDDLITTLALDSEGEYTLLLPKDDNPIAIELLVDSNGDGLPSRGERFAVIEEGGKMIPSDDREALSLDATEREFDNQAPE